MKSFVILFTALSFTLVVNSTAFAAADFRCGNTFVEPGKSSTEILLGCG